MEKIFETRTNGCVYSLSHLLDRFLAASIGNVLVIYEIIYTAEFGLVLQEVSNHYAQILPLFIKVCGDEIIVGDLMKSVSVYKFDSVTKKLEEVARDFNSHWITAVTNWDSNCFLAAENSYNIFALEKCSKPTNEFEQRKLEVTAAYHLGDFINKFQKGSIVHDFAEQRQYYIDSVVFGTVLGCLGVIFRLEKTAFDILSGLQANLSCWIKGVGGFEHQL